MLGPAIMAKGLALFCVPRHKLQSLLSRSFSSPRVLVHRKLESLNLILVSSSSLINFPIYFTLNSFCLVWTAVWKRAGAPGPERGGSKAFLQWWQGGAATGVCARAKDTGPPHHCTRNKPRSSTSALPHPFPTLPHLTRLRAQLPTVALSIDLSCPRNLRSARRCPRT